MSENERILIRNAALHDAMHVIMVEMNRIMDRPMGEAQPSATETLVKMNREIFNLRK